MLNLTLKSLWWTVLKYVSNEKIYDLSHMNMTQEESKPLMMLTLNYCTNPRCFLRSSRQSFFALISLHSHSLGLRSPGHQGELSIVITLRIPSEMCSPAPCFHNSRDKVEKLVISTSYPHLWLLVFL